MEDDKINCDTSDKRKVEDDSPKPNPKRIKLVRPVFSPVTKPSVSTTIEINKCDVQPKELPLKPSTNSSGKVPSVVDGPPQPIEQSTVLPETIRKPIALPETVKKLVVTPIVSEEQTDSSSDALDIINIFSEKTKKELEHFKKNIFKMEDDGSSSENDSQPKRPRLKRPTFITSGIENKVESNNTKILDKTNETQRSNLVKPICEETINTNDKIVEKSFIANDKIDKSIEDRTVDINVNDVERTNVAEKKIVTEIIEKVLEPVLTENINRIVEKKSTESISVDNPVEKETSKTINIDINVIEEKTIEEKIDLKVTHQVIEVKHDDLKTKQNTFQVDTDAQEKIVEKEKENELVEEKHIDNQTSREQSKNTEVLTKEIINAKEKIDETAANNFEVQSTMDDVKVILERYIDKKSNIVEQNEKPITNVKVEDNEISVKTGNEGLKKDLIKKSSKHKNNEEIKTEIEIENSVINDDALKKTRVDKMVETNKVVDVENEIKCNFDVLSDKVSCPDEQTHKDNESQTFKSDILKAALMSKKSPESLVSSLEEHDQLEENIYSVSENNKTEILPKIGQEAIVNKIEAEIKLTTKVQLTNNKKSQNMIYTALPEIKNSKQASTSVCLNENIIIGKTDEPPKWGSAKMNEVEKFLNDSNVTITPICKSEESPKLGKITLKLPKIGNPEIKCESIVRPDVKSELIKKITNKQIAMGDSPLKSALSQPSKSFSDFATIRPTPKLSAEQIAILEQQILNTPKKRGRPSKALAQQKQLLLQYQQQQQQPQQLQSQQFQSQQFQSQQFQPQQQQPQLTIPENNAENEVIFHVPLFDMEDMSEGVSMFDSFDASTPKRGKAIRGKSSRGRRGGKGGRIRGRDGSDSDTMSNSRRMDDEGGAYNEEMNQEEETKQVAMMEAERLRKEEERERKMEARKRKLKERNDALKEKKMKKKQKAEERRLQWHEKKKKMQEEKARAAEMKKSLPPPQNFDDETRMSADCNNSRSQTPARNFIIGEDDLSISGTTNDSIRMKKGRMEVIDLESNKTLTVDQIAEYQWPLEGGELYMIQEQISNFLGVKSFKRKYPGLKRRNVEAEERTFLCDSGLVAESLCDLGLTVLYSSEVLDIMYTDFQDKYEELREYMRLKHAKELSNRQRALMTISSNADGSKLDLRDRAMEAVANWNANLNKSRLESRKCSMDMQTFIVHYPKNKCKKMTVLKPKIGNYPLALLPGQFCDYYATYSSEDLRYLPMNTVMYGPLKSVDKDFPVSLSSQSESEDSSSDDSSDSDDSIDADNKVEKNDLENGPSDKKGAECKLCLGTAEKNKKGSIEPLIHCSKCLTIYHPTCLERTLEMIPYIKRYNWQCNECKSCAQCKEVADEDKMLFCDLCDRGYHIYCVGLRKVPEGRWHCQECAMCSSCGVSDPGPGDSKWFYEFKKVEKTGSKVYCRTLCAPCSRLWKKGHYCPNCMRCYPIKNVERMIQCNSCDRYLHTECISQNASNSQVVACTTCEEKAVSRLLTTVPRSLIKV